MELAALERRINLGLEEHSRSFQQSYEHLSLRYGNITKAVLRQQGRHRLESERQLTLALGTRPALRRKSGPTSASNSGTLADDFLERFREKSGTNPLMDDAYYVEDIKVREPKETASQASSPVKGRTTKETLQRPSTAPEVSVRIAMPDILAKSVALSKVKGTSRPINYNTIDRMRSIYSSAFKERHDTLASRGLPPWRGVNDGKLASQS